jgi:hypothetical protein
VPPDGKRPGCDPRPSEISRHQATDRDQCSSPSAHDPELRDLRRSESWAIPTQLRRRREASRRCEPLESGLRDPADPDTPARWADREVASWLSAAQYPHSLRYPAVVPDSVLLPRRGDVE